MLLRLHLVVLPSALLHLTLRLGRWLVAGGWRLLGRGVHPVGAHLLRWWWGAHTWTGGPRSRMWAHTGTVATSAGRHSWAGCRLPGIGHRHQLGVSGILLHTLLLHGVDCFLQHVQVILRIRLLLRHPLLLLM